MSNTTVVSTAAIDLNITSLTGTISMGLICIFMFSILLRPIIQSTDVVLILVANNYLALFAFGFVSTVNNIYMVRGDYKLFIGEDTIACRIRGYIMYSLMATIFNTFALQVYIFFFFEKFCSLFLTQQTFINTC